MTSRTSFAAQAARTTQNTTPRLCGVQTVEALVSGFDRRAVSR
jgi:hypothetical protein